MKTDRTPKQIGEAVLDFAEVLEKDLRSFIRSRNKARREKDVDREIRFDRFIEVTLNALNPLRRVAGLKLISGK